MQQVPRQCHQIKRGKKLSSKAPREGEARNSITCDQQIKSERASFGCIIRRKGRIEHKAFSIRKSRSRGDTDRAAAWTRKDLAKWKGKGRASELCSGKRTREVGKARSSFYHSQFSLYRERKQDLKS